MRRKREERAQEWAVGTGVGGGQGFLISPL
jgi:hypothetical protein